MKVEVSESVEVAGESPRGDTDRGSDSLSGRVTGLAWAGAL